MVESKNFTKDKASSDGGSSFEENQPQAAAKE